MNTNKDSTYGIKDDLDKLRIDLIPPKLFKELGKIFTYGAKKYGAYNWVEGIEHSRLYSAAQRHLLAYFEGEDFDKESNISHLTHAIANIGMILASPPQRVEERQLDDRKWMRDGNFNYLKYYHSEMEESV